MIMASDLSEFKSVTQDRPLLIYIVLVDTQEE